MIERQRLKLFWWYVLPAIAVYGVFFIYPYINAFYISLTGWDGFSAVKTFVGLKNFVELFGDKRAILAIRNNIQLLAYTAISSFVLAMLFAIFITQFKLKGSKFFRTLFFFPNLLSVVVAALVWMLILSPTEVGLLNSFLGSIGLKGLQHAWLGELKTVIPALSIPWTWMSVGFYMILYIAAIQSIPDDILEAAVIDGASKWRQIIIIIIPLIWETIRISIVFFLVDAFSGTFVIVNLLTKGGPARASELLTTYMYNSAFNTRRFGYATAIGVLLFFILVALSLISMKLTQKEVNEF